MNLITEAIKLALVGRASDPLKFWAPLTHTAKPLKGIGTYDFTRDSGATVIDHEGKVNVCKTGEIRFPGARRVENKCTKSKNASDVAWVKSGATVNGDEITFTASGQYAYFPLPDDPDSKTYTASFDLSGVEGETISLMWITSPSNVLVGKHRFMLTPEKRRYSITHTFGAGAQTNFRLYIRRDTVDDTAGTVSFTNIQITEVPIADEYVSAGVGTGPELVSNGDFSLDGAGWIEPGGSYIVTYPADTININRNSDAVLKYLEQAVSPVVGKLYAVTVDVAAASGVTWEVRLGGATSGFIPVATTGVNTFLIRAIDTTNLRVGPTQSLTGTLTLNSISVKEADHGLNVDGVQCFDTELAVRTLGLWGDSLTNANHDGSMSHPWGQRLMGKYNVNNLVRGGVNGETSTQIASRMTASSAEDRAGVTIIWAGRNNFTSSATVQADIAAMVAATNGQYLVLSIVNSDDNPLEYAGGAEYDQIIALNDVLASTYGSRYVDMRAHLVSQYDPEIPQDVIDFGNDIPPSSLRFDTLHYNKAGYKVIEEKLIEVIDGFGWFAGTPVGNKLTTLKGYIREPQRTNIFKSSENFNAIWTLSNLSVDQSDSNNVLGVELNRIEGSTGVAGFHRTNQTLTGITISTTYTASIYAKAGEENVVGLGMYDGVAFAFRATFDLTTGIASAVDGTAGMELVDAAEGIYRCWATGTTGATIGTPVGYSYLQSLYTSANVPIGNGLWHGAIQLEEGSVPTSYIPTDTAAVQRNADTLYYDKANIDDAEGTIVVDAFANADPDLNWRIIGVNTTNHSPISYTTGTIFQAWDGTVTSNSESVTGDLFEQWHKVAVSWKTGGNLSLLRDGGLPSTENPYDGSFGYAGSLGVAVGFGSVISQQTNAHIGDLKIYKKELSLSKKQTLTTAIVLPIVTGSYFATGYFAAGYFAAGYIA